MAQKSIIFHFFTNKNENKKAILSNKMKLCSRADEKISRAISTD